MVGTLCPGDRAFVKSMALMMKIPLVLLGVLACRLAAATPVAPSFVEHALWPGNPPGMVAGATPGEDDGTGRYRNVGIPGLLLYQPDTPAPERGRIALIVCPGGGYTHLTRLEGADGAVTAFLPKNVTVISLKYRTRPPSTSVDQDALADGERAVRLVRYHAKEWGINPHKIGMLGWSAGANLALNVSSHGNAGTPDSLDLIERESSRPNFVVLLSPWPSKRTAADYPISPDAPPAFIGSALDDKTAPVGFARDVSAAFEAAGVQHQLWVVPTGGHGAFTINAPGEGGQWIGRLWPWLQVIGIRDR